MIFINHSHCMFHYSRCHFGFSLNVMERGVMVINVHDFDHQMLCLEISFYIRATKSYRLALRLGQKSQT